MNHFFTADLHLGLTDIALEFLGRPFACAEDHDLAIINGINSRVSADDKLYIVGDAFDFSADHRRCIDLVREIKCRNIILVVGNHDPAVLNRIRADGISTHAAMGGDSLFSVLLPAFHLPLPEHKTHLHMYHYPIAVPLSGDGNYSVHGHLHGDRFANGNLSRYAEHVKGLPRTLNAAVDVIGYAPVTFDELVKANEWWRSR